MASLKGKEELNNKCITLGQNALRQNAKLKCVLPNVCINSTNDFLILNVHSFVTESSCLQSQKEGNWGTLSSKEQSYVPDLPVKVFCSCCLLTELSLMVQSTLLTKQAGINKLVSSAFTCNCKRASESLRETCASSSVPHCLAVLQCDLYLPHDQGHREQLVSLAISNSLHTGGESSCPLGLCCHRNLAGS